ncbi:hypothetical protein BAUCODRAFT_135561 [Baudoinia panamericana UAMH 10762]|uniref:5'-Nucleotidase C-terminal domain-containing protein n=1 Tax=Baudoinia panamericana (strain UAMH 10762) TaxID=717646 RepID=M2NNH2_BAUPA|nr:uncharacterized protein BAUCODRAFT_135561 [Baudoinia panamericana UAMH 10762]EMD00786.1 hypothetical protein BAUCODRAFT_135561 [Baudoinia panamericana UAMH 10762]
MATSTNPDAGIYSIGASTTYTSGNASQPPALRFLHYNDVYHVEAGSRDPVGGIARFKTVTDHYQQHDAGPACLTFFSGDAFNPSLESSVTKGKHMVPALNLINTDVACLGNHDLDFGVEQFEYLAGLCTFPWLCANVIDPALGADVPLGRCKRSVMFTSSNGIKVGVAGLVEREWLDTINSLPPDLIFIEPEVCARELAAQLRREGAEMVVLLTHQREPNDGRLARDLAPGLVDIILSGHDHFYAHSIENGTHILRSGTDFKQLSYLEARRKSHSTSAEESKWDFTITRHDILSSIPANPEASSMVDTITASLAPKLEKPVGYTAAPLDARFTTVRTRESNLGNFVCDLMRFHYNADCALIAAGTIRGDCVYPPGMLKVKDMMDCFPFEDPCVVIGLKGADVVRALENGVSKYPALEGRFPHVSGIRFVFDPSKAAGERCSEVEIHGAPVDVGREYSMVTREYMQRGKDGYGSLMLVEDGGQARSIVGDESGMLISMLLRQYFMSLKILGRWRNWGVDMGRHWKGIHEGLHEVHPVREPVQPGERDGLREAAGEGTVGDGDGGPKEEVPSLVGKALRGDDHDARQQHAGKPRRRQAKTDDHLMHHSDSEDDNSYRADLPAVPTDGNAPSELARRERELVIMRRVTRKWWRLAGLKGHPALCDEQADELGVHWTKGICPRLEGRVRMVGT